MELLIVSTGRSGTLSLAKWFNELFEKNKIKASAAHEFLAAECYQTFDTFYRTNEKKLLESTAHKLCHTDFNVVIGNGYATFLPNIAALNKNIVLVHLQRRNREAWITSSAKNARFFPFAYKYYVEEELLPPTGCIPRTAAFHVGEASLEEWSSWSLEKKLGWHYDYIHSLIEQHRKLFTHSHHVFTEDLDDLTTLKKLSELKFSNMTIIPPVPKLNSHYFADIETYPPEQRPLAQWLLGNIDWQRVVVEPGYFATYATRQFETIMGWSKSGRLKEIFPELELDEHKSLALIKRNLPQLKKNIRILNRIRIQLFVKTKFKKLFTYFRPSKMN